MFFGGFVASVMFVILFNDEFVNFADVETYFLCGTASLALASHVVTPCCRMVLSALPVHESTCRVHMQLVPGVPLVPIHYKFVLLRSTHYGGYLGYLV